MAEIHTIKDQETPDTPLLLFRCLLADGSVERWSTHGVTFEGEAYRASLLRHDSFELRMMGSDGVDGPGSVSVVLANGDAHYSQVERTVGWKGARLEVQLVFFNLQTGTAASDALTLFRGVGNAPEEVREATVRLSFASRLSLQRVLLPSVRIQRRCPWVFPSSAAEREMAADGGALGKHGVLYRCGYSVDVTGGVGNLNGGTPFETCDYTRSACEQRGMFATDSQGRVTRRFGGVEFVPATVLVRGHGDRSAHWSSAVENETRYNDVVPLVYGTAWYQPPIVFAQSDGNLLRMEVLLGMGEMEGARRVVVNGVEVPIARAGVNMTGTGWFRIVSGGRRTGEFNQDFSDRSGRPLGDPYGSMALLSVVVPLRLAGEGKLPRLEVLADGAKLLEYGADGEYVREAFSNNPAWILLDVLRRCGWQEEEIDLASFAACAEACGERVTVALDGEAPVERPRFQCNLVLRRRQSAADVVRGIRAGASLLLGYGAGGKLRVRVEGSFAVQHGVKRLGSNASVARWGGWPSYEFGDGTYGLSDIVRLPNGEPSVRLWGRATAELPNRYSLEFQDEQREFQQDGYSLVDYADAALTGQEVAATFPALGVANAAQAERVLRLQLEKSLRGNQYLQFETSVRGVGLELGDLITFTYLREGLDREPFRVIGLGLGLNHRTLRVTAQVHKEEWYGERDGSGAGGVDGAAGVRSRLPRPLGGVELGPDGRGRLGITETVRQDGGGGLRVELEVRFRAPVRPSADERLVPRCDSQGEVLLGEGSLAGGKTLYYAMTGVSESGEESRLSSLVRVTLPSSGGLYGVRLRGIRRAQDAVQCRVYRAEDPERLAWIGSLASEDAFLDVGLPAGSEPPPDEHFDHAEVLWRREIVPETGCGAWTATTVGSAELAMTPGKHVGQVVWLAGGAGEGQERVITANDGSTLTVSEPWAVLPDTTTRFRVVEGSWQEGAVATASPATMVVPDEPGSAVCVVAVAANARGQRSDLTLAPWSRWQVNGAGFAADRGLPGEPVFGLSVSKRGTVELGGIGFSDLTNVNGIRSGILGLHYWSETSDGLAATLDASISEESTRIVLSDTSGLQANALIQVGRELMRVVAVDGSTVDVDRGQGGSEPEEHEAGSLARVLRRSVVPLAFPAGFFGSPASGGYTQTVTLPGVRIVAAELTLSNAFGAGLTAWVSYAGHAEGGLRTLQGGQLVLQAEGPLAVQADAASVQIDSARAVRDVYATIASACSGGRTLIGIEVDGELLCELAIPAGALTSNVISGATLPAIPGQATVRVQIVETPVGAGAVPGRDLSTMIRF